MAKKITDVKLYDTLCNNNNWVQYKLKAVRKQIKDPDIKFIINECLDILRCMKKQGQHMENRLRDYVCGIERLGFERKRKS